MFDYKEFPIGSKFRVYKIVDVQVDPLNRKKGTKKYKKQLAYYETRVKHHVKLYGKRFIGTEYDSSNEGYDPINDRIDEGFFIVPSKYYKNNLATGNKLVDSMINSTTLKLNCLRHHRIYHKNSRVIGKRLYIERKGLINYYKKKVIDLLK